MGRTLSKVINGLPKARREQVLARYRKLRAEVEKLRQKRRPTNSKRP